MYLEWPNRFWLVSLDLTLFLYFLKLLWRYVSPWASREYKFHNFWTYGPKVMDVWSFRPGSGRGGYVLEPSSKSWLLAQKVEVKRKKKKEKKGLSTPCPGVDLWPATDCWSSAGLGATTWDWRPLVAGQPATSGWSLVARPWPGPDHWSSVLWPLAVADPSCSLGANRRPAVTCRQRIDAWTGGDCWIFNFFWKFCCYTWQC
jgi:hypothetical protein